MSNIGDLESSSYEEVAGKKVWKDAMTEEYHSIMKNYIWDIVSIPERKSVVTYRCIYKIKDAPDCIMDK